MIRKLIVTTTAVLALAACGGSKSPGVDQVQNDLNSPSGSVNSKQSVAGAYSKQSNSNSAAGIAAGGFAGGGFGLSASNPWSRFSFHRLGAPLIDRWRAQALGMSVQPLRAAQDGDGCVDPSKISGSGDASGGSFSLEIDFSSCATANGVTGKISMSGEVEIDQAAGHIHYKVDQTLTALCSEGVCIDGEMSMEADISATQTSAAGSFIAGWFFTITEGSKTYHTKGGMKLRTDGESGAFDYVVYVKDESGNEVSLVISITGGAEGGSVKIKGTDGEINCNVMSDGSGSCTGSGTIEWDGAYLESFETDVSLDIEG